MMTDDNKERVRLRARDGEAVEWTRRAAQRAGTIKDMMDDAPTDDGVYPVPTIAAAELAVLRDTLFPYTTLFRYRKSVV